MRKKQLNVRGPSPLFALRALRGLAMGFAAVAVPIGAGLAQTSPSDPNAVSTFRSTHDWTQGGGTAGFTEAWADVKTPGDGLVYAVGTITVKDTQNNPHFSGRPIEIAGPSTGPSAWPSFSMGAGVPARQVVVLQCSDATGTIQWQKYYYGRTNLFGFVTQGTNARGISVWPEASAEATRIAICGETYDADLPFSATTAPTAAPSATSAAGFIAVFDGTGTLLWSHHVWGATTAQSCAITDVSIRLEPENFLIPEVAPEVVTYCGISTHGNPGAGTTLTPLLPFVSSGPCMSSGSTHFGVGQWDGIVGRVLRNPGGIVTRVFHAIVAGPSQDGLFGIAELDANRFVAVGGTKQVSIGAPAPGFADPNNASVGLTGPFHRAVTMYFDAAPTRAGGALVIHDVEYVGNSFNFAPSEERVSLARDVHVAWRVAAQSAGPGSTSDTDMVYVAGSTSDHDAFGLTLPSIPSFGATRVFGTFHGPTDGFVVGYNTLTGPGPGFALQLAPNCATFYGVDGHDGLTGVQGWNEYGEAVTAAGFTFQEGSGMDIVVCSHFFNNPLTPSTASGSTAPVSGTYQLLPVRNAWLTANGNERPAVMGGQNATVAGSGIGQLFETGTNQLLGDPAGGGVAVDERARVNVVGQTGGSDWPVVPLPTLPLGMRARDAGSEPDAVRRETDMLGLACGRTDGTGYQAITAAPGTGGTAPNCGLSPFGYRIFITSLGVTGVTPPSIMRMLIDYEGTVLAGPPTTNGALIVSRPTPQPGSMIALGILQIGFPVPAPVPGTVFFGPGHLSEVFVTGGPFIFLPILNEDFRGYRIPLVPGGTGPFTAQMLVLLGAAVGPAGTCTTLSTSSPAMWFF